MRTVFWRGVLIVLCCLAYPAYAGAAEENAAAPRGTLVIAGGALRADNAPVWQRIVALAGGKGARIAVFGLAAGKPAQSAQLHAERLRAHGAQAFAVPGDGAEDPALAAQVASAGGAFFVGGDQARITAGLRRPDGSNTAMLDALWRMYRGGGVIAGTSAGAAVMSSTMFDNTPPLMDVLRKGVRDGAGLAPGLGFIGADVFVDQHLLVRGRFARMLPAMLAKGYRLGLGIDENTAMIVHPTREVEVLGYKGALLVDLSGASSMPGPFNVRGARISYLDHGDRYHLGTGRYLPSADKAAGLFTPGPPIGEAVFSADILGQYAVIDLMANLFTSGQQQATGLAFSPPGSTGARMGFEFRLRRDSASRAYMSATSSAVSLYEIVLDVAPVTMPKSLYGPYKESSAESSE